MIYIRYPLAFFAIAGFLAGYGGGWVLYDIRPPSRPKRDNDDGFRGGAPGHHRIQLQEVLRRRGVKGWPLLLSLTILLGCGIKGAGCPSSVEDPSILGDLKGLIAFSSYRDGSWGIFVANADGSGVRRLTSSQYEEGGASWSPDGERIAFMSKRNGDMEVYIVNADGTGLVNLTRDPEADDWGASWSPDGTMIAFSKKKPGEFADIYVMMEDGTNPIQVTGGPGSKFLPHWSPDGTAIAFIYSGEEGFEIRVLDLLGWEEKTISPPGNWVWMAWSPDGRRMAATKMEEGGTNVFVFDIEDPVGTLRRITCGPGSSWNPGWSPDGRYIVFTSDRSGNPDIYVVTSDGSKMARVLGSPDPEFSSRECWKSYRPGGMSIGVCSPSRP
jgi:TolB protein